MPAERFLTLADVAEILNISASQTYALVRNGELEGIRIGGRGQWRVERDRLEDYIAKMYTQTRDYVARHPFTGEGSGLAADGDERRRRDDEDVADGSRPAGLTGGDDRHLDEVGTDAVDRRR